MRSQAGGQCSGRGNSVTVSRRTKLAVLEIQKGQCGWMAVKKAHEKRRGQGQLKPEHTGSYRPTLSADFIFMAMGSHWGLSEAGKYVLDISFIPLHIS